MSTPDEQWFKLRNRVKGTKGYDQWFTLCNRIKDGNIEEDKAISVFQSILTHYGKKRRHYHNLDHIFECLDTFISVRNLFSNPDEAEFSIWLHDYIYMPRSSDNEERSGDIAIDICKYLEFTEEFAQKVKNLILATKHQGMVSDPDFQIICDIDLVSLALPSSEFNTNLLNIRKEFFMYSKEEFIIGRRKFINAMLDRPSIFQSKFFFDLYETRARENLIISLSSLPNYPWQ